MDLVQQLMKALGIDESQAQGGAGLVLNFAKDKLSDGDFGKISELIPGVDDLLKAAPEGDGGGLMGAVSGLASSMGGGLGKLGGLAELASGFKGLGLDGDKIPQFVQVVLNFVQEKGGDTLKSLLAGVLK